MYPIFLSCFLPESPSRKRCEKFLNNIFWISEDESAIVLGKSDEPIQKCELTFGVQSNPKHEKARLRVEFEVFYIHDCGVEVQINESSDSVFSQAEGNHLMVSSFFLSLSQKLTSNMGFLLKTSNACYISFFCVLCFPPFYCNINCNFELKKISLL